MTLEQANTHIKEIEVIESQEVTPSTTASRHYDRMKKIGFDVSHVKSDFLQEIAYTTDHAIVVYEYDATGYIVENVTVTMLKLSKESKRARVEKWLKNNAQFISMNGVERSIDLPKGLIQKYVKYDQKINEKHIDILFSKLCRINNF